MTPLSQQLSPVSIFSDGVELLAPLPLPRRYSLWFVLEQVLRNVSQALWVHCSVVSGKYCLSRSSACSGSYDLCSPFCNDSVGVRRCDINVPFKHKHSAVSCSSINAQLLGLLSIIIYNRSLLGWGSRAALIYTHELLGVCLILRASRRKIQWTRDSSSH